MTKFLRIAAFVVVSESVIAAVLFAAAGRWDLPWCWAAIGTHAAFMLLALGTMPEDLLSERLRPGEGAQERWFRPLAMLLILAHLLVAGLDLGRFGWTGPLPAFVQPAALVGYLAGFALATWALWTNRFFSSVVRLQSERGHHVVQSGPYRFVRHPGYVGAIAVSLCGGIVLGSLWSLLPTAMLSVLFVARTWLEDRFLQSSLPGYAEYARSVRYRLAPGIW